MSRAVALRRAAAAADALLSAGGSQWSVVRPKAGRPWALSASERWGFLEPGTGRVEPIAPAVDDKLPSLRKILDKGPLVSYRPRRRGVVAAGWTYLKVLRRDRVTAHVAMHAAVSRALAGSGLVTVPEVTADRRRGVARASVVPGRPLHRLIQAGEAEEADLLRAGAAIAALHAAAPPPIVRRSSPPRPVAWVVPGPRALRDLFVPYADVLPTLHGGSTWVHGDLHDKQFLIDQDRVGLIDFDEAHLGWPEEDLGNLTAHLWLRALQGASFDPVAAGAACVAGYREAKAIPLDSARMRIAEATTLLRLAVLYLLRRSGGADVVAGLLDLLDQRLGVAARTSYIA